MSKNSLTVRDLVRVFLLCREGEYSWLDKERINKCCCSSMGVLCDVVIHFFFVCVFFPALRVRELAITKHSNVMIQIYRVTHKGDNIPFGLGLVCCYPPCLKGRGESDQLILCVWVAHCAMVSPLLLLCFPSCC